MDWLGKGSWLGITRQGRFALLTNYRDPSRIITDAPSRGELVSQYLTGSEPPARYAQQIHTTGSAYSGFNLIVGDADASYYVGNRPGQAAPDELPQGARKGVVAGKSGTLRVDNVGSRITKQKTHTP